MVIMSIQRKPVPSYWITSNEAVASYLDKTARKGGVFVAGRSAGGREILAYEFGEKSGAAPKTSLSSACAAGCPEAFLCPEARMRPSLFIYSTIHGAETEGCASLINLINILERGADLRGREWPGILSAAEKLRLLIVPLAQPDGRARVTPESMVGGTLKDFVYYARGEWADGTPVEYPLLKTLMPLPLDKIKFLGGYFNDKGVNIQHDDFFGDIQPETQALIKLAHDERPDCVLACHACEADPGFSGPDLCVNESCRGLQAQIAAVVLARQLKEGLRPFPRPNLNACHYFYLQDILHMASGALPLLYEFPHGLVNAPFTHDEIIDIGLTLFEEVMSFGLIYGFHPRFNDIFLPGMHGEQSPSIRSVINKKAAARRLESQRLRERLGMSV
jgi:hypothetical protein